MANQVLAGKVGVVFGVANKRSIAWAIAKAWAAAGARLIFNYQGERLKENVMIGGFILGSGSGNTNVVIRGLGPSLGQLGLSNVLADPTLALHDGNGALLISNDNWMDDPVSAAQLTANGLTPQNPSESGIFTSLLPGAYTAILAGQNGGVGIGLVEIYSLQ